MPYLKKYSIAFLRGLGRIISDNKLKDIEEDCCLGVNQLFSGKMDKYFMNRTKANET